MIYLKSFSIPSTELELEFLSAYTKNHVLTYSDIKYPFGMLSQRLPDDNIQFNDITIFCGNNGSGKSTILNIIAEKLKLKRNSPFNTTEFFKEYTRFCRYTVDTEIPAASAVITSDDVFDKVLSIRRINSGIDDKRDVLANEWVDLRYNEQDTNLHGFDDYDRWKKVIDAKNRKIRQEEYLRTRLMRNITERSNGESALSLFVDAIHDNALYILDEPENSLSPMNQLEFRYFLENCVRHHGCQFIISTHSPFLLSLKGARIYDIDSNPVKTSKWTELPCVKVYKDFFEENSFRFE